MVSHSGILHRPGTSRNSFRCANTMFYRGSFRKFDTNGTVPLSETIYANRERKLTCTKAGTGLVGLRGCGHSQ